MAPRRNAVRMLVMSVIMAVAAAAMVVPTTSTNVTLAKSAAARSACTIRHCQPCGGYRRGRCVRGTKCAKNNKGALSCVKPMGAGQKCTDPCWTCATGLRCGARGTCETIPPPAIAHCRPCGGNRRGRCVRGTKCAKNNKGALSCVKPMGAGQKCTDPCWACATGLRCGARGTCEAIPPPAIAHCRPCGGNRRGRCVRGTKCAKNNKGALSCVKPMGAGQKCTDPCWACATGLLCGARGVCERPYTQPTLKRCGNCGRGFPGACPRGTTCMSTNPSAPHKKTCAVLGRIGTYCLRGCARCPGNAGCGPRGCVALTSPGSY